MPNKPYVIGLTGNIGSGKSTVSRVLEANGAYIIDADETSHRVMQKGCPAYDEVVAAFGTGILSSGGAIDRKALGNVVFADAALLNKLVGITHKYIIEDNLNTLNRLKNDENTRLIVLSAPLLIESGMDKFVDSVWVVFADEDKRVERVMKRDSVSKESVLARVRSQTQLPALLSRADEIIENNGTPETLKQTMEALLTRLRV